MKNNEKEILNLLMNSERELLLMAAQEMPDHFLGVMPPTEEGCIEKMKKWLDEKRIILCVALHASETVMAILKNSKAYNRVNLILAIADAITTIVGGAPVLLISIIIVKNGVLEFCPDFHVKPQENET